MDLSDNKSIKHFIVKETKYDENLDDCWFFCVDLLSKIQERVNTLMISWADRDINTIDYRQLDFSSINDQIEHMEWNANMPQWHKEELADKKAKGGTG